MVGRLAMTVSPYVHLTLPSLLTSGPTTNKAKNCDCELKSSCSQTNHMGANALYAHSYNEQGTSQSCILVFLGLTFATVPALTDSREKGPPTLGLRQLTKSKQRQCLVTWLIDPPGLSAHSRNIGQQNRWKWLQNIIKSDPSLTGSSWIKQMTQPPSRGRCHYPPANRIASAGKVKGKSWSGERKSEEEKNNTIFISGIGDWISSYFVF